MLHLITLCELQTLIERHVFIGSSLIKGEVFSRFVIRVLNALFSFSNEFFRPNFCTEFIRVCFGSMVTRARVWFFTDSRALSFFCYLNVKR